jgi:hypothetical protein
VSLETIEDSQGSDQVVKARTGSAYEASALAVAPASSARGGKLNGGDYSLDDGHEDDNGTNEGQNVEFEGFAEFYDAVDPKTDPERALVASYWTQVRQKKASFGSQEVNQLLKDLGQGVGTINKAMSANIDKKPALILQVSRGGTAQQARKKYKLTEAGKKWVLTRLT